MENIENQGVESKKEEILKQIREKYPDIAPEDEAALMEKLFAVFADNAEMIHQYDQANEKFNSMLSENPKAAEFLGAWNDGKDPVVEFIRLYGDELKNALDDPTKLEAFARAQAEGVEKLADLKNKEKIVQENLQKTIENFEQVQKETGYPDDVCDDAFAKIKQMADDAILGLVSKETIMFVLSGLTKDADLAKTADEAAIRAKNEGIEELKLKTEKDIPPALGGGVGIQKSTKADIPGALGKVGGKNVWDYANEKRSKSKS